MPEHEHKEIRIKENLRIFLKDRLSEDDYTKSLRMVLELAECNHESFLEQMAMIEFLSKKASGYKLASETFMSIMLKIIKKCTSDIHPEVQLLKRFLHEQDAPFPTLEEIKMEVRGEVEKIAKEKLGR